jgi:hypothetical protein
MMRVDSPRKAKRVRMIMFVVLKLVLRLLIWRDMVKRHSGISVSVIRNVTII